eukprot:3282766-Rhodomonas_salina.1
MFPPLATPPQRSLFGGLPVRRFARKPQPHTESAPNKRTSAPTSLRNISGTSSAVENVAFRYGPYPDLRLPLLNTPCIQVTSKNWAFCVFAVTGPGEYRALRLVQPDGYYSRDALDSMHTFVPGYPGTRVPRVEVYPGYPGTREWQTVRSDSRYRVHFKLAATLAPWSGVPPRKSRALVIDRKIRFHLSGFLPYTV